MTIEEILTKLLNPPDNQINPEERTQLIKEFANFLKEKRSVKPTIDEVKEYCRERKNNVDPQRFFDFYEANGWRVGRNPMKNWKAAIRNWESREIKRPSDKML